MQRQKNTLSQSMPILLFSQNSRNSISSPTTPNQPMVPLEMISPRYLTSPPHPRKSYIRIQSASDPTAEDSNIPVSILVVDDQRSQQLKIEGMIRKFEKEQGVDERPIARTFAKNLEEAKAAVQAQIAKTGGSYDAIILDFNLPGGNGDVIAAEIAKIEDALEIQNRSLIIGNTDDKNPSYGDYALNILLRDGDPANDSDDESITHKTPAHAIQALAGYLHSSRRASLGEVEMLFKKTSESDSEDNDFEESSSPRATFHI